MNRRMFLMEGAAALAAAGCASLKGNDKEKKMVRHVILWKLKDGLADARSVKVGIKQALEGLKGKVPGLLEITVYTEGLASSNADVMLDCTLESEEALRNYAVHPAHVAAATTYVRPYTALRLCLDFNA